ncbi:hypothetical protein ACEZ3G_06265 [Maribacter algicola]|uniref:Uncharacterized protein n=1 Tax=Meishania litoralis TaxID=3434685 RepID=A0ACC7LH70_9FLAO
MADKPSTTSTKSEEIDLGQLFQMFRKGLHRIFVGVLRIFLYLKKNALKLGALIFLGLVIGFLLNIFVDKKLKSEVIVMPNFESKDYLYDVVEEIQANFISNDTLFFRNMGIDVNELRGFEISIQPVENEELDAEKLKESNDYLEILQTLKEDDFVFDVIKSEILKKTVLTHRITFYHKNPNKGEEYVSKIMDYINANPYFTELRKVSEKNAKARIEKNTELIEQIDDLVAGFNKQMASSEASLRGQEGVVLFDKERSLDLPGLLKLKNELVKEIEEKQLDLIEQKEAIGIINFGKTQVVKKQFLNKSLVWLPAILVGLFFAWSFLVFLNRKAKALN